MMLRSFVACALLIGCGTNTASDDGDDASAFDGDCAAAQASCGQISARWTLANHGHDTMCDRVGATEVTMKVTFQADGRTATFHNACSAGALLSSKLPLGPYALALTLSTGAHASLDMESATTTLGVAGSVAEAQLAFSVSLAPAAGEAYGTCTSAGTCDAGLDCITLAGSHLCAPSCTDFNHDPACKELSMELGRDPFWTLCQSPTANGTTKNCLLGCDRAGAPACPDGTTCRTDAVLGPVCAP